jgi:hypothetical protein
MERSLDLVRQILLEIESKGSYTNWFDIDIEEYSPEQMDYHLELMLEAGLIATRTMLREPQRLYPVRLTWEGHEFMDVARDQEAKEIMAGAGLYSFEMLKQVLAQLAQERLERYPSLAGRGGASA